MKSLVFQPQQQQIINKMPQKHSQLLLQLECLPENKIYNCRKSTTQIKILSNLMLVKEAAARLD